MELEDVVFCDEAEFALFVSPSEEFSSDGLEEFPLEGSPEPSPDAYGSSDATLKAMLSRPSTSPVALLYATPTM